MKKALSPATTELLVAWQDGDERAGNQGFARVYEDMHNVAHRYEPRRRFRLGFETTSLVHETFLRLAKQEKRWQNRSHFFGIFRKLIPRVITDRERQLGRAKRKGVEIPFEEELMSARGRSAEQNDARWFLRDLSLHEPELVRVLTLRFFGGLTGKEICRHLGISDHERRRLWKRILAWVHESFKPRVGGS